MTPDEKDAFRRAEERIAECKRERANGLDLSGLGLTELPAGLRELTWLKTLELGANRLDKLPDWLGELQKLQVLRLQMNPIQAWPTGTFHLKGLRELTLWGASPSHSTDWFNSFPQLVKLSLGYMGLTEIPPSVRKLRRLTELNLTGNRLTELPEWLGELPALVHLWVLGNELEKLPDSLRNLKQILQLYLVGNPKLGLPKEILAAADARQILDYYFRTRASAAPQPLNEFKLILVGRGGVGKTTLVHHLQTGKFKEFKRTPGIKITQMPVTIASEAVQAHVWDFGGQEIMHGTHRFFMTERALYVVLISGREGTEDHDAEYWLSLVRSFAGDNAPVIVLRHKWDDLHFELNTQLLRDKYGQNLVFLETDSYTGHGIKELHAEIIKQAGTMPGLKAAWPGEWRRVKDELPQARKNYLTFDGFRTFCAERGVTKAEDQEALADYLHELGLMLAYRKDEALRGFGVLNPQWITQGIYAMLNARVLKEAGGKFEVADFAKVLPPRKYPEVLHPYLLALMRKFRLCHPLDDKGCKHLIPELLTKEEPKLDHEFASADCLGFIYRYDSILPEGLMSRFIVETYVHSEEKHVWRTGVVLKRANCRALVRADTQGRKVSIWVTGVEGERRELMGVIREHFERIHGSYEKLPVTELIPVLGNPSVTVPRAELGAYLLAGDDEYKVVVGRDLVAGNNSWGILPPRILKLSVKAVLEGIDVPGATEVRSREMVWALTQASGVNFSLFISYSHKDERFRDEFRGALTAYERKGELSVWQDTMIVPGQKWEPEILRKLEQADIVVLLLSNDFIKSDYCMVKEFENAKQRDAAGECVIVPIVVRACPFKKLEFGKIQAIYPNGKAIKQHRDRDVAWLEVTKELDRVIERLKEDRKNRLGSTFPLPGI